MTTDGDSAKNAIASNNALMAKVIEGLKSAGIAAKDIQNTTLHVEPRSTQAKDGQPATIAGYRVINQVRITVPVERLGNILDHVIALGANQINSISFEVAKAETLKDEARKQAMANAKRRAELYASAADAQLGQVMSISESAVETRAKVFASRAGHAEAATPIETGTRALAVEVQVTYALR